MTISGNNNALAQSNARYIGEINLRNVLVLMYISERLTSERSRDAEEQLLTHMDVMDFWPEI